MKKAKIMLTVITVLTVVGSALAFKAYNGAYICQATSGNCPTGTKYKITTPPAAGTTLFCDNGSGSGICNNQLRVTAAAN